MLTTTEGSTPAATEPGHLVLSRKRGQRIVVGDGPDRIVMTIIEVRGDRVRVGIRAPRALTVHREEVFLDIQEGKRS